MCSLLQAHVASLLLVYVPVDNQMNGVFCSENEALWTMVREEWGFHGSVITDWYVEKVPFESVTYDS